MRKLNVGIVGCGDISGIYIQNAYRFQNLHLVALAALNSARPLARIEEIKAQWANWKLSGQPELPRACSVEQLLADPQVEMVLNLTVPKAHAQVSLAALAAGKHVYSEKPLACTREEAAKIFTLAGQKGLRVGCAPDTFLGAALQTCRKLIDDGWIGTPLGCTAFMTCRGHESWHSNPEFYYQPGGGPLFDMGPYYLTALVHLMGPIKRIGGVARTTFPTRTITSRKKFGAAIPVETPTHILSTLEFAGGAGQGAIGTMLMSFDVFGADLPRIEIYGTSGSLSVPDPNCFGGEVKVKIGRQDWAAVPLTHAYRENARGLGAADLASGHLKNRPHRASGELAYHVVDVMETCLEAAREGRTLEVKSTVARPEPMPMTLLEGQVD